MNLFRSLHARILTGYVVVGGLFVVLVASALIQFRGIEEELAKQRETLSFYDAIRHARRLEKNYLLYLKPADIQEALEKTDASLETLAHIRAQGNWLHITPDDLGQVQAYRDSLERLMLAQEPPPSALASQAYLAGLGVIKLGERLDQAAETRVDTLLTRHHEKLWGSIAAALLLALVAGILVTRSVVRPLRELEARLHRVAKGETGRVDEDVSGSEVAALSRSINDTLQEVSLRQADSARASRLMALGTMLSGVAHELNNPLSNLSTSCQILLEEWQELPPAECVRLLEQIDHQTLRAQQIISALLDFSRTRPLSRQSQALLPLVEAALANVAQQRPPGVTVSLEIADNLEIGVEAPRFQQVLVNLIRNAYDALAETLPGGAAGQLHVRAWREDLPEGRGTTLEIEDNGPGIPAAVLPRIFDPFFTTKAVGRGIGLGLAIAHDIVSQHGGKISVDALPQHGTRFWLHIPDLTESPHA